MFDSTLDFLAICSDSTALQTLRTIIHKYGHLHCIPEVDLANDYIGRRRIDGIIIDTTLDRSLNLMHTIRTGKSNKQSVIYACVGLRGEGGSAIAAGANLVLYKPLVHERILKVFEVTVPMMEEERKRYFRYHVAAPVSLTCGKEQYKAMISNLSETGMAIRSTDPLMPGTSVDFAFDLPNGPRVKGRGEIVWSNSAGSVGIMFHFLAESAHRELPAWLTKNEPRQSRLEPGKARL
jgi:hypothetical protein